MAPAEFTNPLFFRYSIYSKIPHSSRFQFTALPCINLFHQNGILPICWCIFQKLWQWDTDKWRGCICKGRWGAFCRVSDWSAPSAVVKRKLMQTREMWIQVLNMKCLLSRRLPAGPWAQLESRAGASMSGPRPAGPCVLPSTARPRLQETSWSLLAEFVGHLLHLCRPTLKYCQGCTSSGSPFMPRTAPEVPMVGTATAISGVLKFSSIWSNSHHATMCSMGPSFLDHSALFPLVSLMVT